MNLINGIHHSYERKEHAFMVLRKYTIISQYRHLIFFICQFCHLQFANSTSAFNSTPLNALFNLMPALSTFEGLKLKNILFLWATIIVRSFWLATKLWSSKKLYWPWGHPLVTFTWKSEVNQWMLAANYVEGAVTRNMIR